MSRTRFSVVPLPGGGGGSTPLQVSRHLVAGVLTLVGCRDYISDSDGTMIFVWMMFGEIIG